MDNCNRSATRNTMGVDLSDRFSYFFTVDSHGEYAGEGRVPTSPAAFRKHFGPLEPALIAIETGTHSPWASRLLAECGHEVIVANARQLRLIYKSMEGGAPSPEDVMIDLSQS